MGLFSKETKEEKAFWKAFKDFCKKPSEKSCVALEEAYKNYPEPWNGYFVMALCYDCAVGLPFDKEKAEALHLKAEAAAANSRDAAWVNSFYNWYRRDAFDLLLELGERSLRIRRVGIASMHSYQHHTPVIIRHHGKDDAEFWHDFFMKIDTGSLFKSTDEQIEAMHQREPFVDLWISWNNLDNVDGTDTQKKYTNTLIDEEKKHFKHREKHKKETEMYSYVLAYYLLNDSPYNFKNCLGSMTLAGAVATTYLRAASIGCSPAIHKIVDLCMNNQDNYTLFESVLKQTRTGDALKPWVGNLLDKCIQAGDVYAAKLKDMYY